MSVGYQAVGWNRTKKIYDGILASGLVVYLGVFVGIGSLVHPNATAETLLICGLGTTALLLHIILCIGLLCRLDRRFLPLLYNRRHLGVTMFVLALAHSAFSTFQFHALGNINPLVSLFASNTRYTSVADFPFQALGFLALAILFLMAATSHDFWLHNLTAPVWKRLHMLVFVAYALLIAHVTFGALQSETSPLLAAVLGAGLTVVTALHVTSAVVERRKDTALAPEADGYVAVCTVEKIPEKRACVVSCGGDRVAVFKVRRKCLGNLQCVSTPERAAWGRKNHRRMCYLSMAWLPVPARFRRVTSALHGEGPNVPHARRWKPGVRASVGLATGHTSGTLPNPGRIEGRESCATSLSFTLDICRCPRVSSGPLVGWSWRLAL
jgi:DMSO/TMAO reductase YedYZ heme-binding membrane subunit